MSTFYSIPIPEPIAAAVEQLAQIQYRDEIISAYWYGETRQVLLRRDDDWFIQPNGSVLRSLAALLRCSPHHLAASNLFFFEAPGRGVAVDNYLGLAFYSCEWSDYACDRIAVQFNLELVPTLQSTDHQMSYVIAQMYARIDQTRRDRHYMDNDDEDIYADMPALTPLVDETEYVYNTPTPTVTPRYMTRSRTRTRCA